MKLSLNFSRNSLALVATVFLGLGAHAAEQSSSARLSTPASSNVEKAGDFGLGVQWGQNTGIEAKYWTTETAAIGFGAAFADGNTAVNGDYLVHYRQGLGSLIGVKGLQTFVPYAGGGLIAAFGENTNFFGRNTGRFGLAARIPLGIEFLPP